jgi:hypothetical protein
LNSPLTYREYAYFFPAASDEAMAKAMLVAQFDLVCTALKQAAPGKLVNLAIFDVAFPGRPPVPPVVTLTWKDWKGEPTIEFPRRAQAGQVAGAPAVSPPQAGVPPVAPPLAASGGFPPPRMALVPAVSSVSAPDPAPPAEPASIAAGVLAQIPEPPPAPSLALAAASDGPPQPAPLQTALQRSPAPGSVQSGRRGSKPAIRLRGDELIADLFEAMHDLHFLRDSVEGADFCLTLALEKIPSRVGIVHLYDIDRREFVVTCARGPNQEAALLQRYPEGDPILAAAMRRQRAIVWSDAGEANTLERYRLFGGARSLVVAPVILAGRFLGALELLDPVDGSPFSDEEGYALTYIGEQFAEFVAARGVTVDPERIAKSSRG